MSTLKSAWETWRPETSHDREAVLAELEAVLASPHFCNSKRYPALLRYVVESALAGRAELLKERTLGVEVFHRPPDYDTNADTVVRYTAGEVRKRLSLYYSELDPQPPIHISLPAGSYVPEFLQVHAEPGGAADQPASVPPTGLVREPLSTWALAEAAHPVEFEVHAPPPPFWRRHRGVAAAALLLLLVIGAAAWRYRGSHQRTAVDEFWTPVLRNQRNVLVCTGGVVFNQGTFSGVITAGKDIEYPFVSIQIASAIAGLSALLEHNGSVAHLESAASTPLNELRDQPVILLGGYNNQWTMRLVEALPFRFTPEPDASIVSKPQAAAGQAQASTRWTRDRSQPYSSTDDYAVVARFRDTTTDGWVIVLAGLGRNGTEAAAQFATSPHYMELLKQRAGGSLTDRNIEAVLKISVIEGKTGAPSIEAVQVW